MSVEEFQTFSPKNERYVPQLKEFDNQNYLIIKEPRPKKIRSKHKSVFSGGLNITDHPFNDKNNSLVALGPQPKNKKFIK